MKGGPIGRRYRCPCGELMEQRTTRRRQLMYLTCPSCGLLARHPKHEAGVLDGSG